MTILVTGARGHVGGAVLAELLAAGETVRASSRDPRAGDFTGGVKVVRADLNEPGSLPGALDGVRKVFLYAHAEGAAGFAAAARKAGWSTSCCCPPARCCSRTRRPTRSRSTTWWWSGRWRRPGSTGRSCGRASSRRTRCAGSRSAPSGCCVRRFLRGSPLWCTTIREQVAAIAEAIGEPVRLDEVDVATYRSELLTQLPEVLGRPALTYAEWARDHAADFR